jgi:spore germination cell wall hydrolase CwlJ-like protein
MKAILLALLLAAWSCRCQTSQDYAVAAVICGEAASEGHAGMKAVAEVIQTRCAIRHVTPYQTVTRPWAFSSLNGTTVPALVHKWEIQPGYPEAVRLAMTIGHITGDITHGATHFTRSCERPTWARHKRPVAIIGSHSFYRLSRW